MKLARCVTWLGSVLLLLVLAGPVSAADPEGWAYDLANELMSPFCPGRTLSDCPSDQAKSLALWIVVQEAAGRTRDDVEAELLSRYGDAMRPTPEAKGIGLSAYAIPAGAFLLGGLVIGVFLLRQTRDRETAAASTHVPDPELERIVDEELAG